MTAHLVTFSDESMSRARELCIESALSRGKVDTYRRYSPWDINGHAGVPSEVHDLYETHKTLFDAKRGCGYWAWKPMILYYYVLHCPPIYGINEGDIVVYADAGVEFINNVSHVIERMDQDVFLFGNNYEHAHWCKRDIMDAVWPAHPQDTPQFVFQRFGKQCQASVMFFCVSDYSKQFVKEWLNWCLSGVRIGAAVSFGKDNPEHRDERMTWSEFRYLIDDSPSFFPNHPEFRENRHDQAILTTMAYREGIKLHYWPSSYNDGAFTYEKLPEYAEDDYPILFNHHRRRNHEFEENAAC